MYRVLLVDDESLTLDYLKMAIPKQDPDWEIAGACLDGIQALEWFESHSADLVLTDIKMPEMSGLELCERLHRRNPLFQHTVTTLSRNPRLLTYISLVYTIFKKYKSNWEIYLQILFFHPFSDIIVDFPGLRIICTV